MTMRARRAVTLGVASLAILVPATAVQAGSSQHLLYKQGPIAIPDGKGSAVMKLPLSNPPAGQDVFQVRPNFRIRHGRTRDLKLYLKGPDGDGSGTRTRLLSNRATKGKQLGSGQCTADPNDVGYSGFDDDASESIDDDVPPYAGYYLPNQSLGPFIGAEPEATWRLIVRDVKDGRRGKLLCGLIVLDLKTP